MLSHFLNGLFKKHFVVVQSVTLSDRKHRRVNILNTRIAQSENIQ